MARPVWPRGDVGGGWILTYLEGRAPNFAAGLEVGYTRKGRVEEF